MKKEILDIANLGIGKNGYKLETALAWIKCMQRGESPIDRLREKGIYQIVVYGVTELGELLVKEAYNKDYKIVAITDRAIDEGGYEYLGIPMLKRRDVEKYKDEVIVITSMTFYKEIKNELQQEGCKHIIPLRELM